MISMQILEEKMSFVGNKSNRKRFEKFVAFNDQEALHNIKSNSLVKFIDDNDNNKKEEVIEQFNKNIEQIKIKRGLIKKKNNNEGREFKEKDPYDYDILDIFVGGGAESQPINCNTPGCGAKIFFDKRCVHKTLISERTGKRSLVTLESPYQQGMPKPKRHYCIRGQYLDKDQIVNLLDPREEVIGHILLHQDNSHCSKCRVNAFWLSNYLKEHPEKRKLKGRFNNGD